ncbi:OLC1v1032193C1 [Oldenlandia corymbosa var. corymbosa]|nr:OLC1v1032193C1 [Oldenlandia corymbosa var. corymbosa]
MGYLKEIIDQFDSHTRKDQHQLNELRSKSRSSFMSQLHHHGLLHQRKNFFCIRAECEEDPREVSDYMLSLENVTQVRGSAESSQKLEQIVIGLDDDIARVVDELTGPSPTLSMVTIAGMGGIGKTTLAKKVFHHPSIVYHFHFIAWVNSISSPDQALSHLLQSIASVRNGIPGQISDEDSESSPDGIHDQSREDKGQILWRSLRKRKYLIVVDDLWSFHAWNDIEIYFPDDSLGSRILLTSRFMEFPTFIPRNHLHCMELLNEDKSWEMLQYLVFGANQVYPGELTSIGALIAKKCRGLRLAIVVIAGILLSIPRSCVHWESVLKSINTTESGSVEKCLNILALSYNCLPLHLRACFLFMGSFPANCEIDVQKLINLWIADGLMEARPSKPPEKVAEDCLEDLIRRCLVVVGQRSFDGKIKTCFIHELLRQLCLRESSKESFMQVFPGEAVDQGLEERRHLIFTSINHAADVHLLPPLCHPRSFILHTPGFDISQDVLMFKLSCFKWLRVLDIYFLPLDVFPTGILDLVNLRYLALSISYMLDASISRLWKLQTLVVYGPWIPRVVKYSPTLLFDYWKMRWLRHISVRVPSCFGHIDLPERSRGGYPVSSNLQTLSTVTFSSCTQEAFLLLINLKNLGIYETREDYENGTCLRCFQNLHSLAELETLKCSFFKAREAARSLNPDVLPASLKKLTLIRSYLSWDKMCLLAKLPRLETLKLKDYAFMGEVWEATEVIFGGLKYLLVDKTDLAEWEAEGTDHFPCLKRLVLRSCKSLCEIPFDSFTVLEKIDLHNCSRSAENLAKQFQEQYGFPEVTATSTKRAVEKGGQSYEFEY